MNAPLSVVVAVANEEETLGEFQVAEYIVYLLALDTYMRYAEETTGQEDAEDEMIRKGLRLLRMADSNLEALKTYVEAHLPSPTHKQMLNRAVNMRATSPSGATRRALQFRTLLSRGGPSTMKGLFETTKYVRQVKEAISASMLDDADKALDIFAAIPMKNIRLRDWIDEAAKQAGSGTAAPAPVDAASKEGAEVANEIVVQNVQQIAASGAEEAQVAQQTRSALLQQVEVNATVAAQRSLEINRQTDEPPKRSEVVGVAVAAAVAATSDPAKPQNIPTPLRKLDDEQRAAAMTDGRVLVAAGAGAGKSTTLVSRIEYLVKERRVLPSRILATSFNTKAANELKEKIGRAAGGDVLQQMSVGTMHSLFRKFIGEYGTKEEQVAVGVSRGADGFIQNGMAVARAVNRAWAECFKTDEVPQLKNVMRYKSQWSGNNVTPAQARAQAKNEDEKQAALWYEMYEGFKGAIPGWRPPCTGKTWETFMTRYRPNDMRLGDFDDMLNIFHDILKRSPAVRKTLQGMFDHIMVDEAQDRNQVQAEIIEMISEHIGDGSDGRSLWIVGDDKQSIYGFRGARPDLFTSLNGKEGWKTRMIRTNYRCEPEIVEAANKLISHNTGQIPMEATPSPQKTRGVGSIKVETPIDEAAAAITTIEEIKHGVDAGSDVANNAVLCRTNKEIHSYETACIIRGIPYARKGASSFLGSPETKTFLSYVQLVTGTDFSKMQKALGEVINRPNRFFVAPKLAEEAVEQAFSEYARRNDMDLKQVSPMVALNDYGFQRSLVSKLTKSTGGFKFNKGLEKIDNLLGDLMDMQASSKDDNFTTKDLFDSILNVRGLGSVMDPTTGRAEFVEQTFRETLKAELRDAAGDDDDAAEDENDDSMGLGNISFLYQLLKPDPTDPLDTVTPPNTPMGFKAKIERYAARARDLRIDLTKWDKEQAALPPEQRKPPPGVYLGTVHCSPADEPVLTTTGWVPIGELDPDQHRLASYTPGCNQLFWGRIKGTHEGPDGYGFQKGSRFYKGPLLTLTTEKSKTRVTPDHKIRVKWAESFHNKYVVYLMRRGDWWRIGHCKSCPRPYKAGDLSSRLATEKADAGWILKVCESKESAILEEVRLQGLYGIPGTTFEASKARSVSSEQLHAVHESVKHTVGPRAGDLLAAFGLDKEYPLYVGGPDRECDKRDSFTIQARNCLSGYMLLPVVSEAFIKSQGPREVWTKPEWHPTTVTSEQFEGDVYSLVVFPHHFYVSGGAVVHNSVKGAQWPNTYVVMPKGKFPFEKKPKPGEPPPDPVEVQEQLDSERRLAYVALTRAAKSLTVICPGQVGGVAAGVSPFVREAGLKVGQNVPTSGEDAPVPPIPNETPKEASFSASSVLEDVWYPGVE